MALNKARIESQPVEESLYREFKQSLDTELAESFFWWSGSEAMFDAKVESYFNGLGKTKY